MARDPTKVGRINVLAETFADSINAFVEPISWKTMVSRRGFTPWTHTSGFHAGHAVVCACYNELDVVQPSFQAAGIRCPSDRAFATSAIQP